MTTGPLTPETLAEKVTASDYFADVVQSEGIPKGVKDDLIASQPEGIRAFLASHKPSLELQRRLLGPTSGEYAPDRATMYVATNRPQGSFGNRFEAGTIWSVSYAGQTPQEAVQRTFTHEVGHHAHNVFRDQIDPLLQEAMANPDRRPIAAYADDVEGWEYFAETFSAYVYHRGRLKEFDPVGYDLISQVLDQVGIRL